MVPWHRDPAVRGLRTTKEKILGYLIVIYIVTKLRIYIGPTQYGTIRQQSMGYWVTKQSSAVVKVTTQFNGKAWHRRMQEVITACAQVEHRLVTDGHDE